MEYLLSISLRITILAAIAFVVQWRLRSAAAKHAVWTIVSFGILLQIGLSPFLPSVPLRVLRGVSVTGDAGSTAIRGQGSVDVTTEKSVVAGPAKSVANEFRFVDLRPTWPEVGTGVYFVGVAIFVLRLAGAFLFTRKLLRDCTPVGSNRYQSDRVSVPMTFGNKIILPCEWRQWSEGKLSAVLAHEGAHVRRGDWWITLLSQMNQSVLWFHPLTWWLDRELARLAEQACDDAALVALENREQYALTLLDMARAAHDSSGRLLALAMAKESDVEVRMNRILDETRSIPRSLGRFGWTVLVGAGMPLIYLAAAVQLAPAAPTKATSVGLAQIAVPVASPAAEAVAPAETLVASKQAVRVLVAQSVPRVTAIPPFPISKYPIPNAEVKPGDIVVFRNAAPPAEPRLAFEVAAIKLHMFSGGGGRIGLSISGTTVNVFTTTLKRLIMTAYDVKDYQIHDGPDWITGPGGKDTYDITAKAPGDVTPTTEQARAMLRTLLADRFHLKLRSEKRELQVFSLTVGKNGHKLKPSDDGSTSSSSTTAGKMTSNRVSMAGLANVLSGRLGQPVIDNTGLEGNYSFTIESPEMGFLPADPIRDQDLPGPSLPTALDEQLGLKLTSGKGYIELLVIERVEKPSEN